VSIETLPTVNAVLNSLATVLLVAGYVQIRRGNRRAHGYTMLAAFVVSSLFLCFYLLHKYYHRDLRLAERFPDLPAWMAYVYWFAILIPHLILAMAMLPLIGLALWHAYRRQWRRHTRVTRKLIWIWLYVSVTGVLIYGLLYHLFPAVNAAGTAS